MPNELTEGVKVKLATNRNSLKVINEDIKKLTNYKNSLESQVLGYYEVYGVENGQIDGLIVKDVQRPKKVPLKDILDVMPNDDVKTLLENIVGEITIDLEKTEENLRFSGMFQDAIIRSFIKQLSKVSKETVKKVEV